MGYRSGFFYSTRLRRYVPRYHSTRRSGYRSRYYTRRAYAKTKPMFKRFYKRRRVARKRTSYYNASLQARIGTKSLKGSREIQPPKIRRTVQVKEQLTKAVLGTTKALNDWIGETGTGGTAFMWRDFALTAPYDPVEGLQVGDWARQHALARLMYKTYRVVCVEYIFKIISTGETWPAWLGDSAVLMLSITNGSHDDVEDTGGTFADGNDRRLHPYLQTGASTGYDVMPKKMMLSHQYLSKIHIPNPDNTDNAKATHWLKSGVIPLKQIVPENTYETLWQGVDYDPGETISVSNPKLQLSLFSETLDDVVANSMPFNIICIGRFKIDYKNPINTLEDPL